MPGWRCEGFTLAKIPAVKIERHTWGYFLESKGRAVALVSLRWSDVEHVLKTWPKGHRRKPIT